MHEPGEKLGSLAGADAIGLHPSFGVCLSRVLGNTGFLGSAYDTVEQTEGRTIMAATLRYPADIGSHDLRSILHYHCAMLPAGSYDRAIH